MMNTKKCACAHHQMVPIFIVFLGLIFLLRALGTLSYEVVSIIWPILIILVGLQKMFKGKCKCC